MVKKDKKIKLYKELIKNIFLCIILFILITTLSHFIFLKLKIKSQIDPITANYISFNNGNTTDMLKINNLSKLSDKNGKKDTNKAKAFFKITGKKNSIYNIVIYPKNNKYDLKNIKFFLKDEDNQKLATSNLDNLEKTSDGGIIIYQGKLKKDNQLNLYMWLTKKYKKPNDLTFEIKIKAE